MFFSQPNSSASYFGYWWIWSYSLQLWKFKPNRWNSCFSALQMAGRVQPKWNTDSAFIGPQQPDSFKHIQNCQILMNDIYFDLFIKFNKFNRWARKDCLLCHSKTHSKNSKSAIECTIIERNCCKWLWRSLS